LHDVVWRLGIVRIWSHIARLIVSHNNLHLLLTFVIQLSVRILSRVLLCDGKRNVVSTYIRGEHWLLCALLNKQLQSISITLASWTTITLFGIYLVLKYWEIIRLLWRRISWKLMFTQLLSTL
jgi:hypothetical protein